MTSLHIHTSQSKATVRTGVSSIYIGQPAKTVTHDVLFAFRDGTVFSFRDGDAFTFYSYDEKQPEG